MMEMKNQTKLDDVIRITLNRKEASMLEESLDHCYRMFGGNDLEYDEMIIDVRRQISSKNNIRETNIV
jgi:lysophospholipase L1-like esterase